MSPARVRAERVVGPQDHAAHHVGRRPDQLAELVDQQLPEHPDERDHQRDETEHDQPGGHAPAHAAPFEAVHERLDADREEPGEEQQERKLLNAWNAQIAASNTATATSA